MPSTLSGTLSKSGVALTGTLSSRPKSYSLYTGDYKVTPKTYEQTLETADKVLSENIVVAAVPFRETSNDQNGLTVYIAEEV